MKNKEKMVAEALGTKEGRQLLWEKGIVPAIYEWAESTFFKWDKERQARWMDVAFGHSWRERLPR